MDKGIGQVEIKTEPSPGREGEEIATAIAAAIAVAIQTIQARERSSLGKNLEAGKGKWWAKNHRSANQ